MRGHSVGGFGSVTTNKVIATLVADLFDLHVQAYPKYGAEKKGLPTTYYLTVASERIRIHSELNRIEFVPVNDFNAFFYGNPLTGLSDGGIVFLQTEREHPEEVWEALPYRARAYIREHGIRVLYLDTRRIAEEVSPREDLVMRMQGIVLLGVFLRAAPVIQKQKVNEAEMWKTVEASLRKFFGKRGEAVVQANLTAVKRGYAEVREIPADVIQKTPEEVSS
jgi:pyruvate-ferredoxin/flavodoxin oxidoreductase